MLIGVISDTHGYLHSNVFKVFRGVDHILHAGDIGAEEVILELETIAPVTAVLGNGDFFRGSERYGQFEILDFHDIKILLTHQYPGYGKASDALQGMVQMISPQIIISGHTHSPHHQQKDQVLLFNPGSGGQTLYYAEKSVGLINIQPSSNGQKEVRGEIIQLG
ncbi:MAG: metallophosphoesterase family protein [Candidatus Tectomicrobia bacterium]|uniref:Phosphoesterase n=1 Tax=Tectimicrobiota bacterium TaxID=2528274 RepID=A0A933GLI5_UNCTE|nr:metallophosphoesterase family protein [Candidatus Tectomicrobia bacterium]